MITQQEANYLICLSKIIKNPKKLKFPLPGEQKEINVLSIDGKEKFILDINRARIKLTKCTYKNRYRKDIVLLRLDIDGRPHLNPPELGGKTIDCPHLHIFKEGYGDKWAIQLPDFFTNDKDLIIKLFGFSDYCNINNAKEIQLQGVI